MTQTTEKRQTKKKQTEKRQTGYVYAVRSYQTEDIYIGSTLGVLRQRLYKHKYDLNQFNNGKYHYVTSYEIVKYNDAFIEMIDKYENVNKIELRKYEGQTIRNTKCVNKNIAGRTLKEYQETHKKIIYQSNQKYYEQNKEVILNLTRKRNSKKYICSCGKEMRSDSKYKHNKICKELLCVVTL